MGEVGEVIPEKSAVEQLPATTTRTIASSDSTLSTTATSDAIENPPAQQNGDVVKEVSKSPVEPMAADSEDDDDSQTSCGDNQSDTKAGGESATANGDAETSQDGSESRRLSKDDVETKDSALENGSEDDDNEDGESEKSEKTEKSEKSEKSEQSEQTEKTENTDVKKNGNSTENEEDSQDGGESEAPTSQDDAEEGEDGEDGEDGDDGDDSQDETSQSATNDEESQQSSLPATKTEEVIKTSPKVVPEQKLNGEVEKVAQPDDGVVDLGESDEEMPMADETSKSEVEQTNPLTVPEAPVKTEEAKPKISSSDSDAAVVIGSDSEAEQDIKPIIPLQKTSPEPKAQPQPLEQPKPPQPPKPDDDDDDDCVLIEDDSPSEASEAGSNVSGRQHKNMVKVRDFASFGEDQGNDDAQPSPKRQKTFHTTSSSQMAQITIKDARSLMSGTSNAHQATSMVMHNSDSSKLAPPLPPGGIYPVNILPALPANQAQSPAGPKAIPTMPVSPAIPALPSISNANLLPGLTDDMFVLEAPSFIVPYIYEKPPSDNLREIVTQIETKFDLKKQPNVQPDGLDLDLDDDGKENEENAASASKKKKRKRGSGDDSWSESEDSADDDEDDSDAETRTKVLIKEASDDLKSIKAVIKPIQPENATASMASATSAANKSQMGQDNYFESPLGKFFIDIGVGLVQEFVQADLIRIQKRKMRRSLGKNITEIEKAINALSGNLEASKKRNAPFKFNIKRCEFCNFKSESALAMAHHYETPHMNGAMYKCNFCTYEVRNSSEIVYHMEAMHNIKARLFKHLPYHQCPNCGFEDNGKAKLARHAPVCQKKFRPETNLTPPHDWEAPAKIPRIKPRHGLVGTATAYQAMAAQAAAQKAALATIQQQQQQAQQARNIQAAMANNNANKNMMRGRQQPPPVKSSPNGGNMLRGTPIRPAMPTGMVLPNNYQIAAGQLIQAANVGSTKKNQTGQPSISITPLPRQSSSQQAQSQAQAAAANKMPPAGMKPGQNLSGNKAQFVICEICDGYIKDLEQLRNHMQWMHKVKIHPKMIYNRPPLNCQKCQFRFFTDQGLERHLLGSHGLVTSSMQEAANKGKDAGRCPVCGRMYQWKLLNHVSRDHHMTLKPAHLSYKCTVCTATFGMYKQFETHVYTAHSTVAKKAMDGKKNNTGNSSMPNNSSSSSATSNRSGLSAANDTLLKPLKINDEITIIPQPASKNRSSMNNIESHVID